MNGQVGSGDQAPIGISSWATGVKEFHGAEGTWRDAEDGQLGRNLIAQGSVDSTMALHLPVLAAGATDEAHHWLAVGPDLNAIVELDAMIRERGPNNFIIRTRNYWSCWVNKQEQDLRSFQLRVSNSTSGACWCCGLRLMRVERLSLPMTLIAGTFRGIAIPICGRGMAHSCPMP